jgi:hypothetical protein
VVIEAGSGWVEEGLERWYVDSDLLAAFCRRVCRSIDFQQLNGRRVGVREVIALIL